MFRCFFILLVAILLTSCGSQYFYNQVNGDGQIIGRPNIQWTGPNRFIYYQSSNQKFAFRRRNGEIITPRTIETDGGSIPRVLWNRKGYSPWTYAPAYLIHDWLYEAHRRKVPAGFSANGTPLYYNKEKADWVMAEIIKAQMEKETDYKSAARLKAIYWAVSRFGDDAWKGKPHVVNDPLFAELVPDAVKDNIPLLPALKSVGNEFVPLQIPDQIAGSQTREE